MICEILTKAGMVCETARDGVEALQMVSIKKPDLVITDWRMPRMDGFELVRTLKKSELYYDVPVIILTVMSIEDIDALHGGVRVGADHFIEKPFHPDDLVFRVRRLLKDTPL